MQARRDNISETERLELYALMSDSVSVDEKGFAIVLDEQPERWDGLLKRLGLRVGYRLMADRLAEEYEKHFGRHYLFTEKCMAYEIEYHADAYFWAAGYKGYRRNVTSLLFDRNELISHCRVIDISTDDVVIRRQRLMFRYRKGVRPEYRNTPLDPFDRSAWLKRVLRTLAARIRKDRSDA